MLTLAPFMFTRSEPDIYRVERDLDKLDVHVRQSGFLDGRSAALVDEIDQSGYRRAEGVMKPPTML